MDMTISPGPGVIMIGVFTVEPDQQQAVLEIIEEGTRTVLRALPGFVANASHRSLDGRRVVLYAKWRRREDVEAMRQHPGASAFFKRLGALAGIDTTLCEVGQVQIGTSTPPARRDRTPGAG